MQMGQRLTWMHNTRNQASAQTISPLQAENAPQNH